jgi:hypothetical protein
MTKLLIAFLLSVAMVSNAQNNQGTNKDKERIGKVCDQFMKTFADGKIGEALQLLKQNSIMPPAAIDTLEVTINDQIENIFPAYGKVVSYEFVTEKKVKSFIAKRFYVLKFEKYYLKFDFTVYNNGKNWTITGFNYNDDLMELLSEGMRHNSALSKAGGQPFANHSSQLNITDNRRNFISSLC